MSSEETPKKPRKPRAPKKTAGRVDSVPASAPIPDNGIRQKPPVEGSNNLYFVHPADYHDDDDRIEPTEVVSSASAPMTEKDDRQTETEGKDVAADPSLQPDSFPPPLTDSRETDSGTQGTDSDANVVQGAFMKLKEIAAKILEHLERFEHDPKINDRGSSISPYWNVNAWAAGSKVGVKYVSFQCEHFLTKAEALEYLQWLDSGKVGKHFSVLKRK